MRPSMWPRYVSLDHGPQLHAVMHLQIIRADRQLTGRYVANWPHRWTMWIGLTEEPRCRRNWPSGWMLSVQIFGPRGTLLKYRSRIFWIDGRRTRAAARKTTYAIGTRLWASGCDGETVMTNARCPSLCFFLSYKDHASWRLSRVAARGAGAVGSHL